MERRVETVIIGAGIAGCSIAYHLAEQGYTDVLVLDRGRVSDPLGSTGHAPGLLGRNSSSKTMAALADCTARLFARLPADQPALTQVGSVEVARDQVQMRLLAYKAERAAENGLRARLVSPKELGELVPYMDTSSLVGGLLLPDDGVLDARRALWAMRDEAVSKGVSFLEETPVTGFKTEGNQVTGVQTPGGVIACDRVVVAVGIWGAALLGTLGIELPLFPVQHPYVYTVPLEMLAGAIREASHPMVRDLDHVFYLREHGDRLGYGWYNHQPLTAPVEDLPRADMAFPEQGFLDQVRYDLFPFLKDTPLSHRLNGIFSMTPDGGPLLGEVVGRPGLWLAEAVWVTHSGGVGKAVAELLLGQVPSFDVTGFRPERFANLSLDAQRQASLALYNDIYQWPAPPEPVI